MIKVYIGIDIGSDGAYAIIVNDQLKVYGKIPSNGELDMSMLRDIFFENIPEEHNVKIIAGIEDLHSIYGSSAKSNFQFGVNNGLVVGFLQTIEFPHIKISPKKWQKEMWQGIRPVMIPSMEKKKKGQPAVQKKNKDGSPKYKVDTKATSLIAAKRLFPTESFLATERSKVPHDGIVDAVLIAEYCRRKY